MSPGPTSVCAQRPDRQPIHTLYGGAHLFRSDTPRKLGAAALKLLGALALDGRAFGEVLGVDEAAGERVLARVKTKLAVEPIEDFRIDFEDGYGARAPADEDADAVRIARDLATGHAEGTLPPFIGLRIRALGDACTRERALRTLTLFMAEWGKLAHSFSAPRPLRITLPKVQHAREVALLADTVQSLCERHQVPLATIGLELMVETPAALLSEQGTVPLRGLVDAAGGLCVGVHFGAYDYLASLGIAGPSQSLHHGYCHDARAILKRALAGRPVDLADGATTILPLPIHRETTDPLHLAENRRAILAALATHAWDVAISLGHGFYQSWDLHPGQLLSRYGATYAFFDEGRDSTTGRVVSYLQNAARASATGAAFDDAATVRGHAEFLLRGLQCRAFDAGELAHAGLTSATLTALL